MRAGGNLGMVSSEAFEAVIVFTVSFGKRLGSMLVPASLFMPVHVRKRAVPLEPAICMRRFSIRAGCAVKIRRP